MANTAERSQLLLIRGVFFLSQYRFEIKTTNGFFLSILFLYECLYFSLLFYIIPTNMNVSYIT